MTQMTHSFKMMLIKVINNGFNTVYMVEHVARWFEAADPGHVGGQLADITREVCELLEVKYSDMYTLLNSIEDFYDCPYPSSKLKRAGV